MKILICNEFKIIRIQWIFNEYIYQKTSLLSLISCILKLYNFTDGKYITNQTKVFFLYLNHQVNIKYRNTVLKNNYRFINIIEYTEEIFRMNLHLSRTRLIALPSQGSLLSIFILRQFQPCRRFKSLR